MIEELPRETDTGSASATYSRSASCPPVHPADELHEFTARTVEKSAAHWRPISMRKVVHSAAAERV